MDRLRERPVWSMTGSEKLTALDTLQADLTRLSTRRLELLAALDTDGYATELGARDTVNLIAIRHRLDPTEVRRDLKLAHALPKYTAVSAALHTDPTPPDTETPAPAEETATDVTANATSGETSAHAEATADADRDGQTAATDADAETAAGADAAEQTEHADAAELDGEPTAGPLLLHPGQAAVIVDALDKIPSSARVSAESLRFAEEQMVKAAQVLPPGELRKLGREVRNRLDTDGPEPAEKRAAANERLWLKRTDDGIKFGGFLAGDNAELLQTMVFANSKPHKTPDGQRDPRSRGKLQADGLTDILHTAAATGAAPAHGGIKPHITVTISLADLLAGTGTGDLAHGGTLSAAAIRRLACDAGIIPLVLGANSEPLDVGTEERFVNRAMRRALNARDKGCVVCGAPPAMCEAHHLVHWAEGGPTRVDNLVLLCKRHHIDVHHGHWTITMHNGQPQLSRPDWATPTPTRTPTRTPARAPSPTRTPAPPPDPWTASPPDAPPAPRRRGGSPEPAPETPPGAGPTTPEPRPTTLEPRPTTPWADEQTTPTTQPDTHTTRPRPPGTGPTSPDPWPDNDSTAPATAGGTDHVIARPPGRSASPLGDSPHPLGGTARPLPIYEQLRREFADSPDPWADPPAPPPTTSPADWQPHAPNTNSRPTTTPGG
ncbi:HNH endonuclease [Kribbella sp. VKM Ac-2527]|uniref:HNH endonuclease n=1 Tax=Kribbella caucasensis TaxID=2512215 RepID=A0A4R6JES1_9ACTN|nr:HNH endonuclease signature motif containing protein [Kribbella sp. VKM Ac-2527]TDO33937.1 HNH endonuclease [Kribbella sp. VKM Ac-2527]